MNEKRVYRLRKDRVLAGVCAGLGRYFEVDPILVRLIWIALIFMGMLGIVVYLIAWIIIPLEPLESKAPSPSPYIIASPTNTKRLYRSKKDRVLAGICGGLGKYYEKDPVLFRILAVLLFLGLGIGFCVYLIGIFIIPLDPKGD